MVPVNTNGFLKNGEGACDHQDACWIGESITLKNAHVYGQTC